MITSTVETLGMSIEEIESKFNFAQLAIICKTQSIAEKHRESIMSGKKLLNSGKSEQDRNKNAFRYL